MMFDFARGGIGGRRGVGFGRAVRFGILGLVVTRSKKPSGGRAKEGRGAGVLG
jgi:hypothetical protein